MQNLITGNKTCWSALMLVKKLTKILRLFQGKRTVDVPFGNPLNLRNFVTLSIRLSKGRRGRDKEREESKEKERSKKENCL